MSEQTQDVPAASDTTTPDITPTPDITLETPTARTPLGQLLPGPIPAALTAAPTAPAISASVIPTPAGLPSPAKLPTPAKLRRPTPSTPAVRRTDPTRFGHIDESGAVWLRRPEGQITVGQWAAGTPEEGLAFFGRKYDDLLVEVELAARRLREGRGLDTAPDAVAHVRSALAAPAFLGDVIELERVCDAVDGLLTTVRSEREAARSRQREAALAAREAIVAEAEALGESHQWKVTGERFTVLLEEWKSAPRADRTREQVLWKRFSAARTIFDRQRRQHFASRDSERKEVIAAKESLIREAEVLATTTDWAGTTRAYRALMDRWKSVGHAGRQDEDRLWARFRAAQDAFFAIRDAANAERDVEHKANLDRKRSLAAEAEALLPVTDVGGAKKSLRSIQERWEAIGHVPRQDKERVERRLQIVEDTIRQADDKRSQAVDPARRARAEDTAERFRSALTRAEKDLDKARTSGDQRRIDAAQASVESTRSLLAAVEGTVTEFSGRS